MSTISNGNPVVTLPVKANGNDPEPTPPTPRKRYGQSVQGRMLQDHREAAGVSREELALRRASSRTNRASWLLSNPLATVEWEAAIDVPWIRKLERNTRPAHDDVYVVLHELIDLLPPGATLAEMEAAHERSRKRAAEDRLRELKRRGGQIARLVWNAAESPDFVDQMLADALHAPDLNYAERTFVARAALYAVAHDLRVLFPERPMKDAS